MSVEEQTSALVLHLAIFKRRMRFYRDAKSRSQASMGFVLVALCGRDRSVLSDSSCGLLLGPLPWFDAE
jgi:hypothetical protein